MNALILASQSPRRRELLGMLGLTFDVIAADVDETMDPGKAPEEEVGRLSRLKALAVPRLPEQIVLAADTIVVCHGTVLGKPGDEAQAREMLTMLSGRAHQVMTGLTLVRGDRVETAVEITDLHFRELSPGEIDAYIATGEPMDKAGSYGIQGLAGIFVTGIRGDYYNVVGLPICRLTRMLRSFGCPVLGESCAIFT